MEFRFELPAKFGVGRSNLGVPGHVHPDIKGQWLKIFFDFRGGEIGIFFVDLSHAYSIVSLWSSVH